MSEPAVPDEPVTAAPEPASDSGVAAADQTYVLRPPPPVRALAIASVAAVVGAVIIVVSGPVTLIMIGAVVLALGVLLAATALVLTARLRTTVRMTRDELEVTRAGQTGRLAWSAIDRVQESGSQLVAVARGDARDLVITVPGPRRAAYADLLDGFKQRLDASRGYQN